MAVKHTNYIPSTHTVWHSHSVRIKVKPFRSKKNIFYQIVLTSLLGVPLKTARDSILLPFFLIKICFQMFIDLNKRSKTIEMEFQCQATTKKNEV